MENDEFDRLFHIQEMNLEKMNQKYAANLIVMTIMGICSITSREYIIQNLKSIIFVLFVQTVNFGCTVYRAQLTEQRQWYRCKFLPTVFKVVKAASYWLMLNVIVDYMDKHMPATNYITGLKWALIISNKGFIAYLAYSILTWEGMMSQYSSWANQTHNQEENNTNNEDNSNYEQEDTDEEEADKDEEENSIKKNN